MTEVSQEPTKKRSLRSQIHKWIRRSFIIWAIGSTLYLANSFRTQGVDSQLLRNSDKVSVKSTSTTLEFQPADGGRTGLVFICGAGVAAEAYAPLLRPIAEQGHPVFIMRLPRRFAPFESDKQKVLDDVVALPRSHQEINSWVLSGHSLGAALSCRIIRQSPMSFDAVVLLGTTHPKQDDLSDLAVPFTKVYASKDGVAPMDATLANKRLLPASTKWICIEGGNHSQFGHYGWQILDGWPTISREEQQRQSREAIFETIKRFGE
jgi:hypothetical protein